MITHARKIDMYPASVPVVVHLSQYDDDFTLEFTMFSSVGEFTVETGTTAKIRGTKKDGKGYSANATINTTQKKVTVTGNQQMTAIAGRNVYELVLTRNNKVLSTANFILDVEPAAMDANTVESESVIQEIGESVNAYLDEHPEMVYQVDDTLSVTGAAADAKKTGDEIADLKSDISEIEPGLSDDAKIALLDCFAHVAWIDEHGQDYYDALEATLYADRYPKLTASYEPGTHVVWDTDALDSLKPYLTVTYFATKESEGTVISSSNYTLSGTLAVGNSAINVAYNGLSTSFTVQVSTHTVYALPANYELDGTSDKVIVTDVKLNDTNKTYSIVFKGSVIITDGVTTTQIIAQARDANNKIAFVAGVYPAQKRFSVGSWGKATFYDNPTDLTPGEHTFKVAVSHVAGTDVQLMALKFDGNSPTYTDTQYDYVAGEHPLVVGAGYNASVNPYSLSQRMTGILEEFKVLDYAMTQAELNAYVA